MNMVFLLGNLLQNQEYHRIRVRVPPDQRLHKQEQFKGNRVLYVERIQGKWWQIIKMPSL
ncbi:hypothetical protein DSS66_22705 [Salmonella enterica subsp. enterica serovar Telelkebir]|nr:hypothetical protein [Salmonella enterica subsp. enterica serovar Telelkebir]EBU9919306.1 hypothetical protein [Salmonella enterica subsp. enterica serovar Weybridge]EBZ0016684.1 hypothetical protein [Salmonella enterica subsp. enterica serovar Suberu]ECI6925801.1 hypothetical protein [Salmonella enterica subsp. enterica]EAB6558759.1 hypothetical protein [Salmonella enterica subsp. enterica serovar Telelkebir]